MKNLIIYGIFFTFNYLICEGYQGHKGIYTDELDSGHLIYPRKINQYGEHISNNVTHYHNQQTLDDDQLHYHIEINNETFHIELTPSKQFISKMMIVERHRRDLRTRKKTHQQKTDCHYQGQIRGHDKSIVSLSACNGIAGYIRTNNGDYWMEPSKNHLITQEQGHPHVVFQKSAIKQKGRRDNKKKKKKRRRHLHSNCGTREPKRMIETRIEWQPQGKVIVQGGRRTRGHHIHHNHNNQTQNLQNVNKKLRRQRRSVSKPRHVEVLLVADNSMVEFHQDGDVETYLLTIMNMVSSLYKDPTIGNLIHVVVVKIILMEDEESQQDLNVTHMAETNLDNFCRWQRTLNPKEENDPHHHDVAILITRKNICSKNGCMTLGVANVGGMCRPDRSCSVNEDNGITLAHTITHELGHNFGMYHDTDKIGCERRSGPILHVMTPSFEADTLQVMWSKCSRRDITHFLDQGLGKCLDDPPSQQDFTYPELPPGAIYNADLQCHLQFNSTDESITVCSQLDEICSQLWCLVDGVCITLMRPAAPGTNCGKYKWCQDKKCVEIEELPVPVDGGWGNWSNFSECSRKCGAGISKQIRLCDHPPPAHGGSFCVGERMRYKTCNTEPCPKGLPSFRAEQCSSYDNETFRGQKYKWLPYFDNHEPCELYCTDSEDTVIVPWENGAKDGTPCNIGTNDMCISGICRRVGCNWVVDSNTTEDQCGVCGGTGSTCITIKGEFNKKLNQSDGYYEITTIPSGSRHIHIEETVASKNFLSISKANSELYFLNGNRLVSMSGQYLISGSVGLYSRENDVEVLKIPGPIEDDISLHILFRTKQKLSGIKYEYTLSTNSTAVNIYHWKLGDWTACSRTCGGGIQHRLPICVQKNRGVVDEQNCWSNAEGKHLNEKVRVCNEDACAEHWWIGPWQLCPITCKNLNNPAPIKRRSIMCVDQNDLALPDIRCDINTKPRDTEPCGKILPYCDSNEDINDNNTFD